jgi:tetratricopeptide (TPR) repeat protein
MIKRNAGALAIFLLPLAAVVPLRAAATAAPAVGAPSAPAAPASSTGEQAPPAARGALTADPLELWLEGYRRDPRPGEIPGRILEFARRGALAAASPRRGELVRFFGAAARGNPPAVEALREEARRTGGEGKEALEAVLAAAESAPPPRPGGPADFPLAWAEFRATGDPAVVKAMISLLGGGEDAPAGELASLAAGSLLENAPRHGGALRIVNDTLPDAPERVKAALSPLAEKLNGWYDLAETWNLRGNNLEKAGKDQDAILAYRAAIDVWPQNARYYRNLADIVMDEEMKDRYPEALAAMRIAVALEPGSAKNLAYLGRAHFCLEEFDQAVLWLEKACEADPRYGYAFHRLGRVHLRRNDGPAALAAFRSYLALDPTGERLSKKEKQFLAAQGVSVVAGQADPWRALLQDGREGELEEKLSALLREKKRGEDGGSILLEVLGRLDDLPGSESAQATWIRRLEEWASRAPRSHFARAILGAAYLNWAWEARGHGFASTVLDEGWKLFRERLSTARSRLEEAWNLDPSDPYAPKNLIVAAMGLNLPRPEMETWFSRAVAADPTLAEAYAAKLTYLLPKWHGSVHDTLAFAREAAAAAPPGTRIPLVLAQAHYQLHQERLRAQPDVRHYREPGVWEELGPVYRRHLEQFPGDARARNQFAWAAYMAGDAATARRELAALGPGVVPSVWGGSRSLEAARRELELP